MGPAFACLLIAILSMYWCVKRCLEKLPLEVKGWVRKIPIQLQKEFQEANPNVREISILLLGWKSEIPEHDHPPRIRERYHRVRIKWNSVSKRFEMDLLLIDDCKAGGSHSLSNLCSVLMVVIAVKTEE